MVARNLPIRADTCVAAIDIGLKNFSVVVLKHQVDPTTLQPMRPQILHLSNKNLYSDQKDGKIIKHEPADKLIRRIEKHLDDVGRTVECWQKVTRVTIESQAASTKSIRRVEDYTFSYFVYRHPHLAVKTLSASRKLSLEGMTHNKDDTATYQNRKKLAIKYARAFMSRAEETCPYKHLLDQLPRKKTDEVRPSNSNKHCDLSDAILMGLHMLNLPITI